MDNIDKVVDYINVQRDRYVDELKQYLAIPSVSALPQHQADVRRAAEWSADHMKSIGLENVRLIETPGNPIVYGEWLNAPGAPTILFYGHYDVQPVDPIELWESPPFEATVRENEIYARGAADDKGQVFMHFKAIEAHMKQAGPSAAEHQGVSRGRRRGRQPAPRRVREAEQGAARRRCGGDLRLRDVRARDSLDLLRASRARVLPDRSSRHEERSALRRLWRRDGESGVRAVADARRR